MLAGAATWVGGYGDLWSLLGTGRGALRLLARAAAMCAHNTEEKQFRRIVLAFGALAGSSGAVVLMLAIARWRLETVTTPVFRITGAWAAATLVMAWRALQRLASYLEPRQDDANSKDDDENGANGVG